MAYDLAKPGTLTDLITGTLVGHAGSEKFLMRKASYIMDYRTNMMETTGDGSANVQHESGGLQYATALVSGWVLANTTIGIIKLKSDSDNIGFSLVLHLSATKNVTHKMVVERLTLQANKSGSAFFIRMVCRQTDDAIVET